MTSEVRLNFHHADATQTHEGAEHDYRRDGPPTSVISSTTSSGRLNQSEGGISRSRDRRRVTKGVSRDDRTFEQELNLLRELLRRDHLHRGQHSLQHFPRGLLSSHHHLVNR